MSPREISCRGLEKEHERRARRADIERHAGRTDPLLHKAGERRRRVISAYSRRDDEVELFRLHPAFSSAAFAAFSAISAQVSVVATRLFGDADPLFYPFVVCLDVVRELVVFHYSFRHGHTGAEYTETHDL